MMKCDRCAGGWCIICVCLLTVFRMRDPTFVVPTMFVRLMEQATQSIVSGHS